MLEILEDAEIRKRVAPVTIERYHRMIAAGVFDECPVELINGVIVQKMSKSELHLFVFQVLFRALAKFCPEDQFLVRKEDPLTIGDSEPEPDISVVAGRLEDFWLLKPTTAHLVIEVAISSLALDRAKTATYAQAGVPEVWIVVPEDQRTEVYRRPVDGRYSEVLHIAAETLVESSALPGFAFDLSAVLAV